MFPIVQQLQITNENILMQNQYLLLSHGDRNILGFHIDNEDLSNNVTVFSVSTSSTYYWEQLN